MALYHFWLPTIYRWSDDLVKAPMIGWALASINAFFSFLLLAGGLLTIVIALDSRPRDRASTGVLVGMTAFWLFNAGYQVFLPMPLPARLAGLHWVLLGFAGMVALLYMTALRGSRPQ
jgi:hypothetical protein